MAVDSDIRVMAPLMAITRPNSAIIKPQNNTLLPKIAATSAGDEATPKAVIPVMASAKVIHTNTLRISAGKADDKVETRTLYKEIDNGGYDKTEKCHKEKLAH